jgi:hypothetical protein
VAWHSDPEGAPCWAPCCHEERLRGGVQGVYTGKQLGEGLCLGQCSDESVNAWLAESKVVAGPTAVLATCHLDYICILR